MELKTPLQSQLARHNTSNIWRRESDSVSKADFSALQKISQLSKTRSKSPENILKRSMAGTISNSSPKQTNSRRITSNFGTTGNDGTSSPSNQFSKEIGLEKKLTKMKLSKEPEKIAPLQEDDFSSSNSSSRSAAYHELQHSEKFNLDFKPGFDRV